MEQIKYLYWAFQSSQSLNPTEKELELFKTKYKEDYEQDVVFEGDELLDKFRLNAWRSPIYSPITSIILAFENGDEMRVKYIVGEEKDLLQNFANLLKNSFQEYTLVNFDSEILLPFTGVRLHKNGFINSIHNNLKFQGLKSWNFTGVDLKAYYKGGGKYNFSLKEIAYVLDIDSEGIINYRDEFSYINSGDNESLKSSAIKQVEVMAEIWRKLNNLPKLNTTLVEETVKNVAEEKPKDWLRELHFNGLTLDVKEGLKQQLFGGKKKPTKKDKENFKKIILANYQQKGDKADLKKQKEQIVNNFIDENC